MAPADDQHSNDDERRGILTKSYASAQLMWKFKHLIPAVVTTTVRYYAPFSPFDPSWSLSTSLFVAIANRHMTHLRLKRSSTVDDDEAAVIREAKRSRDALERLIVPRELPKNGAIHEVRFTVKRRNLSGVLRDADEQETGQRLVPAEWSAHDVVFEPGGHLSNNNNNKVLLYLHGGAYIRLSPRTHRPLCLQLSKQLNCRVLSVDYRLSPETKFPGALHDAVSAYFYLTDELKIPANEIIVAGDSAGGNLAIALVTYLRDSSSSMVAGAILLSPWVDLTSSFASWDSNASTDYIAMDRNDPQRPQNLFVRRPSQGPAGPEHEHDDLHDRYVSPSIALPGQTLFERFPPTFVLAGGSETLRDEITLFVDRLDRDGVDVEYEIFRGGVHVFVAVMADGIGKQAIRNIGSWVERKFPPLSTTTTTGAPPSPSRGWQDVELGLERAYEAKEARLLLLAASSSSVASTTTTGNNNNNNDKVRSKEQRDHSTTTNERFIYDETFEPAPRIKLRQDADPDPVAVAAFEHYQLDHDRRRGGGGGGGGGTKIVRPKLNPAYYEGGLWARLHL